MREESIVAPGPGRRVRLLGVPPQLVLDDLTHRRALVWELRLVEIGRDHRGLDVGAEIAQLIEDLLVDPMPVDAVEEEARLAVEAGRPSIDIELSVPVTAREATANLVDALERADKVARDKQLLTLAAGSEIVALRRWLADE
ncbi:MAG: hypothetical protein ACRDYV_06340, partial [Acidimicrobiia bacterium]